jgi:hypothetical protein
MLNLLGLKPGQVIRLKNEGRVEVIENVGDGMWVRVRIPGTDEEELAFCEDVVEVIDGSSQPGAPTGSGT